MKAGRLFGNYTRLTYARRTTDQPRRHALRATLSKPAIYC